MPLSASSPKRTAPTLATPTIYVLLAAVAVMVQWKKWDAFHQTRNLVAFVLSTLILVIAATYLLRAFRARRQAGL